MRTRRLALMSAFLLTFLGLLAAAGWLFVNAVTAKTDESVVTRLSALEQKLDAELAAMKTTPPQEVVVRVQTEPALQPQVEIASSATPVPVSLYQDPFDAELQRVRRALSEKVGVKVNDQFLTAETLHELKLQNGQVLISVEPLNGSWASVLPVGYELVGSRVYGGSPLPGEEGHFTMRSKPESSEGKKLTPEEGIGIGIEFLCGEPHSCKGLGWEMYKEQELFLEVFLFIETPKGEIRHAVLPRRFLHATGELAKYDDSGMFILGTNAFCPTDIPSLALRSESANLEEYLSLQYLEVGDVLLRHRSRAFNAGGKNFAEIPVVILADERMPTRLRSLNETQTWKQDVTGFHLRKAFFFRTGVMNRHQVEIFAAPDGVANVDIPFRGLPPKGMPELGALVFYDLPDASRVQGFSNMYPVRVVAKSGDQ